HTRSYGDWSSDVCSSDLQGDWGSVLRCSACGAVWGSEHARELVARNGECLTCGGVVEGPEVARIRELLDLGEHLATVAELTLHRSEERRVGKGSGGGWGG